MTGPVRLTYGRHDVYWINMVSQDLVQELAGIAYLADGVETHYGWILKAMQRHGSALVSMLWRILGNEQDVSDVYQSTFLHLAHVEAGHRPANVKGYLFKTAANIAISLLRSRTAERKAAEAAGKDACRAEGVVSPSQELDQAGLVEDLRLQMTRLPDHLRQVLILRDLAELSYGQIGKILGISANSARVYRCRAIRLLALWMEPGP